MKTTHSFSIDFIIRKCKEDKTKALIYARISVDSERKEISLKERIIASEWDSKNEVVNGRSIESKSINRAIEEYRFKIKQKYRELQEQDALITAESVKNAYLGIHTKLKGHSLLLPKAGYDGCRADFQKLFTRYPPSVIFSSAVFRVFWRWIFRIVQRLTGSPQSGYYTSLTMPAFRARC